MKLNEIKDNDGANKHSQDARWPRHRLGRARPPAAASRARRPVPASPSTASRAARCRSHRRLPKRGFNNIFRPSHFNEVTLARIQACDRRRQAADRPATIDAEALVESGVIRRAKLDGVRLVAMTGELKAKVSTFDRPPAPSKGRAVARRSRRPVARS